MPQEAVSLTLGPYIYINLPNATGLRFLENAFSSKKDVDKEEKEKEKEAYVQNNNLVLVSSVVL